jgi:type II secretory pathway pseudopilin PulG
MATLRTDTRGFTLVEVLITTLLTLVVSGVALSSFVQATRSAASAAVTSDVNLNLRIAMNLVIRDLIQTGQGVPTGGIPLPRGGPGGLIARPGPIGSELTFPPEWETLPAVSPGPSLGPVINGVPTDLVTVVRADPTIRLSEMPIQAIAANGSSITIPAAIPIDDDGTAIREGDLIMFSNANGNAIQEVTSVAGQTIVFGANAGSMLNQPTAPQGSVLELRNANGTWPPTTVSRMLMLTYYIIDASNGGTAIPALVRRVNFGPERLLATGIENVQLTWDLVDGISNPTNVDEPHEPNTPHQIRKANLHMAARSLDPSPSGSRLHASLTTQVSLRSLAFVDRYR